jgi:DNA-binding SARP family transcriptional activator
LVSGSPERVTKQVRRAEMASDVQFRILGPVGLSVDGTDIHVGAPRQRALLAMLLLDANRAVHPSALIEGIWGDVPPQHPEAALQIVVSRLRSALGPAASRITSERAGYRILVGPDELDLERAQQAFDTAREHFIKEDNGGAAAAASAGLACWSGEALGDIRGVPFYETASRELRSLQFSMYDLRNRAYLRCGRHVEVLADIDGWLRSEPARERTRAHQMVALFRVGRRVDAFAAYEELRRYLDEELGVEPSAYMQELRRRIEDQDPTLLARRAGIVPRLPAWTACDLPFVGRIREELRVFERLREVAAGAARMVLITGEAGIGKSRLLLEIARRAYDETIVLAVDGADALQPGVQTIAAALFDAAATMSDAELECCLGRWPGDVAALVPALRRRFPGLPPAFDGTDEQRSVRRRDALVSWIAGMSQRAPVLLVLDDLHRAGPELLFLLGALLAGDDPDRVLVLASARRGPNDSMSRLEQLVHRVDEEARVDRIELDGLSLTSVQRLLTELGTAEADFEAAELAAVTQGRPDRLAERLRDHVAPRPRS